MRFFEANPYNLAAACLCVFVDWWRVSLWLICFSTTALKKCFRGVYGTSVYSYLRTYRLQVAQKLLLETELPVTEIASKIGYENPNKFTSAFKEMYGSSPTEFRKSVRLDRNGPYGVAKKSELY